MIDLISNLFYVFVKSFLKNFNLKILNIKILMIEKILPKLSAIYYINRLILFEKYMFIYHYIIYIGHSLISKKNTKYSYLKNMVFNYI